MSRPLPLPSADPMPPPGDSPQPHAQTHKADVAAAAMCSVADALSETAAASSSSAPSSSACVTDASTKSCSSCLEDRPLSSFSSAQIKKKGKRVCNGCVAKKEAAATVQLEVERGEKRSVAFEARLNAAAESATPLECPYCGSSKAARLASCPRCTLACCSVACFRAHPCDMFVDARRTMPTTRVSDEDRLQPDEVIPAWNEIVDHLRQMMARFPLAQSDKALRERFALLDSTFTPVVKDINIWDELCAFYSPRIADPWWNPSCCKRLGLHSFAERRHIQWLVEIILRIVDLSSSVIRVCCAAALPMIDDRREVSGVLVIATSDVTSVCLMSNRLIHKLLTLLLWMVRAMDPAWLAETFHTPVDVSADEFGMLPLPNQPEGAPGGNYLLGYMQHVDPKTDRRTLVPLLGSGRFPFPPESFDLIELHLGHCQLAMITQDGLPVRERGVYAFRNSCAEVMELAAVTGWTGRPSDSFVASPARVDYYENDQLEAKFKAKEKCTDKKSEHFKEAVRAELAARARPDYFHLVPALKQLVGSSRWPELATPQLGLESELVELALLESLGEEAAEADRAIDLSDSAAHPAQLLIAHIEDECGASIAEVIARQKSRVEWMMEAQAEQMRIHAEAVERANNRGKLAAPDSSNDAAAAAPTASSSSSSSSALAPFSAASSSSSSSSSSSCASSAVVPLCASASSSSVWASTPAASWTLSKAYQSVAALCKAGRVKYATITSAALRFLHSLRPVSVNRSGGSHTVFHFAHGKPVTLVRPHGGDGTVSKHAVTTLYQAMHEAAMQQMEGSVARAAITPSEQ